MEVEVFRVEEPSAAAVCGDLERAGFAWARFGDEIAVVGSEGGSAAGAVGRATNARAPVVARRSEAVEAGDLHLVQQKGRLFQHEHPEVPVLLDKGRFLLVRLTPAQRDALSIGDELCYRVSPLELGTVAFEARGRPAARGVGSAWVGELVAAIDSQRIRRNMERLTGLHTRFSTSTGYGEAADFAHAQLEGAGFKVERMEIRVHGRPSQNVVATRPGQGAADDADSRKRLLVVAHLDSLNDGAGPGSRAPGADDNASGSVGALEIAHVLGSHPGLLDLQVILFGGEEQGLVGSKEFLLVLPNAERERIEAVVNMDMIGRMNAPAPTVLLEGGEISRPMIEALEDAAANHTGLAVQVSFHPHDSDHEPFILEGIPAALTIEGADGANGDVHSDRDTLDKIDIDFMAEVLRMNVAYVATALGRAEPPAPTEPVPA